MKEYKNVHILDHPLIRHKLAIIRNKNTDTKQFREIIGELATLMAYESFKDVPTQEIEVETPLEKTTQTVVKENSVAIVPILRAGLGMVDGILSLFPAAKVGHIGLYRENFKPVEYFCKLPPDLSERDILLLDPMLATGGSAAAAIQLLHKRGAVKEHIKFLCLVASPEGLDYLQKAEPEITIYTTSVDERLNENKYIVPGLGDAGDRIFGTL